MKRQQLNKHDRTYLRAPISGKIIFVDEGNGLVAYCKNISEGGLLIEDIPKYPASSEIPLMIAIPKLPILSTIKMADVFLLSINSFDANIIRVKGSMVRGASSLSDVERVFNKYAGIYFVEIGDSERKIIQEYVESSSKNLNYLISLFDRPESDNESKELLRRVAMLLGYNQNEKMAVLRKQIVNDYISLEEL